MGNRPSVHLPATDEEARKQLFKQFSDATNKERILLLMNTSSKGLLCQSNDKGVTLLHQAAKYNDTASVQYLIDCGADCSAQDDSKLTALHVAATEGSVDCLPLLVNTANCHIDTTDVWGWTALHRAVINTQLNVASWLMETTSCDVDVPDCCGRSALHVAASYGRLELIQQLVSRGACVNRADLQGRTALYLSVVGNQLAAAQLLVRLGCDVNGSDRLHTSPLYVAIYHGNMDFLRLLLHNAAHCNKQMIYCALDRAVNCQSSRRQLYLGVFRRILAATAEVPSIETYMQAFTLSVSHGVKDILSVMDTVGTPLPQTLTDRIISHCPTLVDVCRRRLRKMLLDSRVKGNVFSLIVRLEIPSRLKNIIVIGDVMPDVVDCFPAGDHAN